VVLLDVDSNVSGGAFEGVLGDDGIVGRQGDLVLNMDVARYGVTEDSTGTIFVSLLFSSSRV